MKGNKEMIEFLKKNKVLILASKEPADRGWGNIWCQMKSLEYGLNKIDENQFKSETIEEKLKIPIVFQDETLTTRRSQELSIEAGIKRKKRKALEDAYSATLILQSFLDSIM